MLLGPNSLQVSCYIKIKFSKRNISISLSPLSGSTHLQVTLNDRAAVQGHSPYVMTRPFINILNKFNMLCLLLLLPLTYIQCGHIYSAPLEITYPIATKFRRITLTFALQTSLDVDEFLQIGFPFPIHSKSLSATLRRPFVGSVAEDPLWNPEQTMESGSLEFFEEAKADSATFAGNIYNFNFKVPLQAKTWYRLELQVTSFTFQTAGYKNPIRMATVSSLDASSLIYDENPSFATLALGSLPQKTIEIKLTYSVTSPGQSQPLQIDFTPTVSVGEPQSFLIDVDNNYSFGSFSETEACQVTDCTCKLLESDWMLVECSKDVANTLVSVNVVLLNAPILVSQTQSTTVSVYSVRGSSFLEHGVESKALQLKKIDLTVKYFFLWGVAMDTELAVLYKPAVASPGGYPFNNFRVTFQLGASTPDLEHLVIVSTGEADAIPEQSIAHNLGEQVVCYFKKSANSVYCKRVQQLTSEKEYFIAFKCAFRSTAASQQNNFGKVSIKSVVRSASGLYQTYFLAGPLGFSVPVLASVEFTDPAAQSLVNFGYTYVSSGATTGTFSSAYTPANGMTVGLRTGVQRLLFYVKVLPDQMCPLTKSYCGAGKTPEIYMKLLFNKNQINVDASTLMELSATCTTPCSSSFSLYQKTEKYLLFKCSKNYDTCTALFNGNKGFGFLAEILSHTSLYPSTKSLDFILAFYEGSAGTAEAASTLTSVQLIQGYTLGVETPTVQASYVNFYTKGALTNTASSMPCLLRLLGTMNAPSQHLAIIVDQAVDYFFAKVPSDAENDDDTGSSTNRPFKCSLQNCYFYPHWGTIHSYSDHYMNQRMLLLKDFPGSAPFDVMVALQNQAYLPKSIVFLAVKFNSETNAYDIDNAVRVFGAAFQIPNLATSKSYYDSYGIVTANAAWVGADFNGLMGSNNVVGNYKVADLTTIKPGDQITLKVLTEHTDVGNLISINAPPLVGGGFTIHGIMDYEPTFTGGTCIRFSDIVFCPFDLPAYNDITVGNSIEGPFKVPTTLGQGQALGYKYAWSTKAGNLAAYKAETQSTPSTAQKIGCAVGDISGIFPQTRRQAIGFTITPQLKYELAVGQQIQVILTFSAFPGGLTPISYCSVDEIEDLSCSLSGSTNYRFQLTALKSVTVSGELKLRFYATHSGSDKDEQTYSAQIIYGTSLTNIVESCDKEGNLKFEDNPQDASLSVTNFKLQNKNLNTKSYFQLEFSLINRQVLPKTAFTLTLGFLGPTNSQMFSSTNARCLFYSANQVSRHWAYLSHDSRVLTFAKKSAHLTTDGIYTLHCKGVRNPDGSITDPLVLSWVDLAPTKPTPILQRSVPFAAMLSDPSFRNPVTIRKYLNAPGFGAYYEFSINPSRTNITHLGRIDIEFSAAIAPHLPNLECYLNEMPVHCSQQMERRVTVTPVLSTKSRLRPNIQATLRIGPVRQPRTLDSFGRIWLGINLGQDDTYEELVYVTDPPLQGTLPTLIPSLSILFTALTSRTNKVYLRLNITAPARVINVDKLLAIELPQEIMIPNLRLAQPIECRLYRQDDVSRQNFTQSCGFRLNRLIVISMRYDSTNARLPQRYSLEIRSLYTPDWVNTNPMKQFFPTQINVFVTDSAFDQILFSGPPCLQYFPQRALQFIPSNQKQFQWYVLDVMTQTFSKLQPIIGFTEYPTYQISRGLFKPSVLFLGLTDPTERFQRRVTLSIEQESFLIFGQSQVLTPVAIYNNLNLKHPEVVDPNPDLDINLMKYQMDALLNSTKVMSIDIGDAGYYFHMAARPNVGSGIYYLNFQADISDERTTFTPGDSFLDFQKLEYYSVVPMLAVTVETSTSCQITIRGSNELPINGYSDYIYVSSECIPISELLITPLVTDPLKPTDPIIFSAKTMQKFYSGNPKESLSTYFRFQASENGNPGDAVTVKFQLTGEAAALFKMDDFIFILVANQAEQELTANTEWDPEKSTASVTCSKDGSLFFSISNAGLTQWDQRSQSVQSTIVDGSFLLYQLAYYIDPTFQFLQYYKQAKGPMPVSQSALHYRQIAFGMIGERRLSYVIEAKKGSRISVKVTESDPNTQLQLYCEDRYMKKTPVVTQILTGNQKIKNHTLITLEFTREISSSQVNNLVCTFRELLALNRHHVMDVFCYQCNINMLNYTKKLWPDVIALNETVEEVLLRSLAQDDKNAKVYLYVNNYPLNSGAQPNINEAVISFISALSNSPEITFESKVVMFGRKLVNATTDPEITYLFRNIAIVNYTEVPFSAAQNQVNLKAEIRQGKVNVTIEKPNDVLLFLGLSESSKRLDFSTPLQLRQGVDGNGIELENAMMIIKATSFVHFDVTEKEYFLQWSSAPLQGNCLASSYQETQLIVLELLDDGKKDALVMNGFLLTLIMMII